MKKILTLLSVLVALGACCNAPCDPQVEAAKALASRILPTQAQNIDFVCEPAEGDYYRFEAKDGRLCITANNANSMAVGLNNYLKEYCKTTVTWYVEDEVPQPAVLPATDGVVSRKALGKNRFFLNYCTFGYTLNWWEWNQWERLIDWMALNGVTMALANTGQEAVWQRVWRKHGMTDEQIRAYFTGPSFLAWHRMVNIDEWSGPLPQSWIDAQVELQKKIIARENALGISPILGAFSGHVPEQLMEIYPDADIRKLSNWADFGERYNCWYLNPVEPLFQQIAEEFLTEQKALFGQASHIYGLDLFNEIIPPSWEPDYLRKVTAATWDSLVKSDPDAIWLQMAWTFYHHRKWWTPDVIKAYLEPVPQGRMLLLDYYCEMKEIYPMTERLFGHDYIWSYLGNFGGTTNITGNTKDVAARIDRVFEEGGENFTGFGCTLEGFSVSPFMYEYVLDRAWEKQEDLEDWIENVADRHAGVENEDFREGWETLCDKVYISGARSYDGTMMTSVPYISAKGVRRFPFGVKQDIPYNNKDLMDVWQLFVKNRLSETPSFRFDCVNVGRQYMETRFHEDYFQLLEAYEKKDLKTVVALSEEMKELLDDVNRLVSTHHYFLAGKWNKEARRWGTNQAEQNYYEEDARRIITVWGGHLSHYANRCWNGLIEGVYRPVWHEFFKRVISSLENNKEYNERTFLMWASYEEWAWTMEKTQYISEPVGDSYDISRELYQKWSAR